MTLLKHSIWAVSAFFAVSWATAQVPVYLTPDIGGTPLTSVTSEELQAQNPQPVLDEEQAAQGWKWADLPGSYTGHVESAQVTKTLKVQPSTLVYAAPDDESTVLTVLQDTDEHTVNASSDDWAEVTFTKAITVYFLETEPKAPMATGLNAPIVENTQPAPAPVPVTTPTPEPALEELDVFATDDPELTKLGPELQTGFTPPSDILRSFTGTFNLSKTRMFGRKPLFPAELTSPDGKKRIAFLNLENCVMHQTVSSMQGKTVTLQAVVTEGDWRKDVVLDVRSIRVLH